MAEGGNGKNVNTEITLDVVNNAASESHSDFITGRLKKKGKYSTKWYRCTVKLEKDCFVYKRDDKVCSLIFLSCSYSFFVLFP